MLFAAGLGLAACQAPLLPNPSLMATPSISPATASPSASPTPTPLAVEDWGPLAVADDPGLGGLDANFGPGVLRIGPHCVTLKPDGADSASTLIWRSGETRWESDGRSIVYRDRDLGEVRLVTGDRVRFGGAMVSKPNAPDQGAPQPTWLVRPDKRCPSFRWLVMQVTPEQ